MECLKRTSKLVASFIILFLFTGLGPCTSLENVCSKELSSFNQKVFLASSALAPWKEPWKKDHTNRTLASTEHVEKRQSPVLAVKDRESWQHWARDRLLEVQGYIDALDVYQIYAEEKQELSQVANELVVFHGYVGHGDIQKMDQLLLSISQRSEAVWKRVCQK